jgi:tetratricopeptide (TPR) repeat protein
LDLSPEKGIKLLRSLARRYGPNVDVYYNTGVTLVRLGELEKAASCFEDILKLEPDNSDALRSLDLTRRTIRILKGNEKFATSDLEWMGGAANAARNSDIFQIALRIGEKMVEADPGVGALNDLGLTHQCMGEYDKAIECFDRALQIEPDMPEALSQKALCLMIKNRLDEASVLYSKVVQLKPDFPQGWYNLGIISIRKNNYDEAITLLDKAIGLNDEYYMAWFAKCQALRGLNRMEDAAECLKRAIAINPEYVAASLSGKGIDRHTSNIRAKSVAQSLDPSG